MLWGIKKIIESNADYILAVKKNQGQLCQNIQDEFRFDKVIRTHTSEQLDHGRIETRNVRIINDFQFIENHHGWKNLTTIIKIESIREFKNSEKPVESAIRYYIASLEADPIDFQKAIRAHWSIENKLHWALDASFVEDASRKRAGNATQPTQK
tara:strand:+ start:29 stop:490 length:462 start_codon:yes stop_codon:yes gene_type:complete